MKDMEHNTHHSAEPHEGEISNVNVLVEKKDRFLPISILVAAVVIGGAIVFATVYRGAPAGGTAIINNGAQTGQGQVDTSKIMALGARDAILGSANAPVTIVEYGDYQCPFCSRFFSQTEPLLIQNYVNTGKAKMVFRDFPFLGPESTAAAEAAQCAEDQNKLWAYHDALYNAKLQDEQKGGGENDGFYNRALFLKLAGQLGLNAATFTTCIDSGANASRVDQAKADATSAGVNSTPTFFVNDTQIVGSQPYAQFQAAIATALAGK